MRRTRRTKRLPSSDEESDDSVTSTIAKTTPPPPKLKKTTKKIDGSSSSESDIENYLQPIDKIDLNSSFFNPQHQQHDESFENLEKKIFNGVARLTDSSSDDDDDDNKEDKTESNQNNDDKAIATTSKLNFQQLREYTQKMEDAKQYIAQYNANKEQLKTDNTDIFKMLKNTELKTQDIQQIDDFHSSDFESCSDSEKEGWETVKNQEHEKIDKPKEGVQITIEMPNAIKKKKKNVDLIAAMKRRLNRIRKENQILIHKVHLLCWIAHGNYVNTIINNEKILACALSLLPSEKCYPAERTDLNYLEQIVRWYKKVMEITEKVIPKNQSLDQLLEKQIEQKQCYNKKMFVYIFIAILRALGIQCRLVLSFRVEPLRPLANELFSLSTKASDKKSEKTDKVVSVKKSTSKQLKAKIDKNLQSVTGMPAENAKSSTQNTSTVKSENQRSKIKKDGSLQKKTMKGKSTEQIHAASKEKIINKEQSKNRIPAKAIAAKDIKTEPKQNKKKLIEAKLTSAHDQNIRKLRPRNNNNNIVISQVDGVFDTDSSDEENIPQLDGANDKEGKKQVNLKKLRQPKKLPKYKDTDSEDDFVTPTTVTTKKSKLKSEYFGTNSAATDVVKLVKNRIKEQREIDKNKMVKKRKSTNDNKDSDDAPEPLQKKQHNSDDEFVPEIKVKRRIPVKTNKVLSSDDENNGQIKTKQGNDVWVEVYLENEEKWISCDLIACQVHCINQLYNRATHPISYIVAWNNNNTLKDVTKRYCPNFNTITRKLRVDMNWWQETLKPYVGKGTVRDKEEDNDLERQQLEMPLPKSIVEYKNHPLYVLKRHLLKFEAIYPPDAPTLGFVRNEPVYSRQCVYTLHSREIWLKHAKVVKPGEKPYKIVKARPKYDKLSNKMITDQLLEIFGPWQTEDYIPPTAENGIVPRNAFGNVELFKPCMLPKKTVHLKLPGLNKIARRLDIDCASAITGFDFHSGWSHPVYDGFVVCEEYADQLVAAWELEQEEQEKKERDKVDKRVYTNWKRLIRGLLIRERLKAKYDFGQPSTSGGGGGGKKKNKTTSRVCTKKKQINRENEDSSSD